MNHSRFRVRRRVPQKRSNLAGTVVRATAFLALSLVCVTAIRWISSPSQTPDRLRKATSSSGSVTSYILESQHPPKIQPRSRRLVYPYSIVPGGVASADELREASAHDSVVASHYSGFNYRRAHLVEVKQAQKVYLSYRLRNKVYWTVRQASLHPGEKLLTDGNLTARTRCGNQVSVLPQAVISPEEPTLAELDRPDAIASGIEALPNALASNLLEVDPGMPLGPSHPGTTGTGGGGPPGVFIPPPLGGGGNGGGPGGGGPGGGPGGGGGGGGRPPATPEPGTIILVISGAGIIFARYRRR